MNHVLKIWVCALFKKDSEFIITRDKYGIHTIGVWNYYLHTRTHTMLVKWINVTIDFFSSFPICTGIRLGNKKKILMFSHLLKNMCTWHWLLFLKMSARNTKQGIFAIFFQGLFQNTKLSPLFSFVSHRCFNVVAVITQKLFDQSIWNLAHILTFYSLYSSSTINSSIEKL